MWRGMICLSLAVGFEEAKSMGASVQSLIDAYNLLPTDQPPRVCQAIARIRVTGPRWIDRGAAPIGVNLAHHCRRSVATIESRRLDG
jgi:hypothetical protein